MGEGPGGGAGGGARSAGGGGAGVPGGGEGVSRGLWRFRPSLPPSGRMGANGPPG